MKGKLKYYTKCEETPNSIEGWSIIPITDKFSSICYHLTKESILEIKDHDRSKEYDIEYRLLTNCYIDSNGQHAHHGVIAEILN